MSGVLLATLANGGAAPPGADLPSSISVGDIELTPTNASASLTFSNTGAYSSVGNSASASGTWLLTGAAGDYDIRFTYTGDSIGLTSGTWYNLGTSRVASLSQTVEGTKSASGTIDIRKTSSGVIQDSCTFSISAEEAA